MLKSPSRLSKKGRIQDGFDHQQPGPEFPRIGAIFPLPRLTEQQLHQLTMLVEVEICELDAGFDCSILLPSSNHASWKGELFIWDLDLDRRIGCESN